MTEQTSRFPSGALGLPEGIWTPFAEGRPVQRYTPGQLIYLQGTEALQFYYILRGTARCFMASEDGDERTLTLHRSGDLMGEAAFFDGEPRVSSAVAITPCEVVTIDRERLTEVFAKKPELAVSMLRYLSKTIRLLSAHVDNSFLSADRRVARYLLSLPAHGNARNLIRCTHEEIGTSVGVSRVTVSRVLGEFERRGWIETGYRCIQLKNRCALSQFSETQDASPSLP